MKNLKLFEARPSFGDLENRVENRYGDEIRKSQKAFVTFSYKSKGKWLKNWIASFLAMTETGTVSNLE